MNQVYNNAKRLMRKIVNLEDKPQHVANFDPFVNGEGFRKLEAIKQSKKDKSYSPHRPLACGRGGDTGVFKG